MHGWLIQSGKREQNQRTQYEINNMNLGFYEGSIVQLKIK